MIATNIGGANKDEHSTPLCIPVVDVVQAAYNHGKWDVDP
jgi:hypothetical protein